jgi:uncharacterized protein (TIGR02646 family)
MKYIQKGYEPANLSDWKAQANENWQPTWDTLRGSEKSDVHQALLQEQGYICCYCGMRINLTTSHIEHFKPRKHFPELALDYNNFLSSCPGEGQDHAEGEDQGSAKDGSVFQKLDPNQDETPILGEHCGHQKASWYDPDLTVSPQDPNCADYFRYTGLGEILPTADLALNEAAKATIKQLRLDHSKLEASRRSALQGIVAALNDFSNVELQKLADAYEKTDPEGKYVRFCGAVSYLLRHYST